MATLNLRRSVLALNSSAPPPHSAKRLRELSRVLRAAKKQSLAALSLRLNTDIDLAIAKLRAHHKDDCWVGPELAEVWRMMTKTSPPQLMVFELWLGEEMIAADFTHPIWTSFGRSVCVVARPPRASHSLNFCDFSDTSQLGFLTARPTTSCSPGSLCVHTTLSLIAALTRFSYALPSAMFCSLLVAFLGIWGATICAL
jgi:hypothetical protein